LTASERRLECWGEPGSIIGFVFECNLKDFRRLEISGVKNVQEGVPFSIYISNVRNPRVGKLGQFRFALLQDDEFKYYLVNVGSLWVTRSPSTLLIKDLSPELPYARVRNNYTFDFRL